MGLQFVLGASGSGKSAYLYQQITRQASQEPGRRYFVIVPEQFNMQTQRDLVHYSPNGGILNIDVLSFPRLASYVFQETGTDPGEVLSETGKNLILRQVAGRQKDNLRLLGGRIDRPGYIAQIKSTLSEFAQYNISDGELEDMLAMAKDRPVLRDKLADMLTIRRAFEGYRRDRFITAEDLLKVLAGAVRNSRMLEGSVLVFDGFTGFTPVQLLAMEELLKKADSVRIALTMDGEAGLPSPKRRHDLFYLTARTVRSLEQVAVRCGREILEPVVLKRTRRYRADSGLCRLEKNLLRYGAAPLAPKPFYEDIHLVQAKDPLREAVWAAGLIWQLTRREGYRYRDIALIAGDLPSYEDQLERIFEEYQIPCFLDRKSSVRVNPCLEMLRGAQRIVEEDFSYESVFHFLRTGFSDLTLEETDRLENYVLAFGIRGKKRWEQEWTRKDERRETDQVRQACDKIRRKLMEQLKPFVDRFSPRTGRTADYVEAIRLLLESFGVREKLEKTRESLEEAGEDALLHRPAARRRTMAMEYGQMGEIVEAVLRETEDLLGEETVSRHEFTRILEAGFDEARVGVIPPGLDQVHVGDIVRTRLAHIKVLLFVGANDGFIPARDSGNGLLSQMERQFFADRQVELAPDARQNGFIQRFYLYQCLTKPSDRLYLSYSISDGGGRSMRPSYLVFHLQKLFPALKVEEAQPEEESLPARLLVPTPQEGVRVMAGRMRRLALGQADDALREMLRQYGDDPRFKERTELLKKAAMRENLPESLGKTARGLYGEPLSLSVSRLETFAQCPFRFFAQYGLRLQERDRLKIKGVDTGSFMHDVMQSYSVKMTALGEKGWLTADEALRRKLLAESVYQELEKDAGGRNLFGDTARNRYMAERLLRALDRSVWAMTHQIRAGEMIPSCFEIPFREEETGEGGKVLISGRIDRIDLAMEGDEIYLKVVDYKSSARTVKLIDLMYGQQLQLVEYLVQAIRFLGRKYPGKKLIPAALFYSPLTDPVPEMGRDSLRMEGDARSDQEAFLRKMRPEGLVNRNPEALRLMDRSIGENGSSVYIPVKLKKDGTPASSQGIRKAASLREIEALMDYAQKKIGVLGKRILAGEISVSPMRSSKVISACSFCSYPDVCGFDSRIPGCRYRRMEKFDKEQIWPMILEGRDPEEEEADREGRGVDKEAEKEADRGGREAEEKAREKEARR